MFILQLLHVHRNRLLPCSDSTKSYLAGETAHRLVAENRARTMAFVRQIQCNVRERGQARLPLSGRSCEVIEELDQRSADAVLLRIADIRCLVW